MSYFINSVEALTKALLALVLIVVFFAKRKLDKRTMQYRFPPGPRGLPFLGNFLQMVGTPAHLKFYQWAEEFGPIYKIRIGASKDVVVINDPKVMREIFGIYPASTGKFNSEVFLPPFRGNYGLSCLEGAGWLEQREFCLKALRNFGLGKGAVEPLLTQEINDLLGWMKTQIESSGASLHLHEILQKATFSTLWLLVTGKRVSFDDTCFELLVRNELHALQKVLKTGLVFFPAIKYLAPESSGYNAKVKAGHDINDYVSEYFKQHHNNFVEGAVPKDLVDSYLERMRTERDSESTFYGQDGWKHCVGTVVTLFLAGAETLASTVNWMIFYLSVHPEVQKRLHEEIDHVVGGKEPNLMDRAKMPYTDAVILETLRLSSAVPLGLLHRLTEDLNYQDYVFPKGTILLPNLYYVHHNPEIWGDPKKFRPERFLTTAGNEKNTLRENVVAFQVGKRQCLGESLSRDTLFLFTVKLLQRFHYFPDSESGVGREEYMEPDLGYILLPKHLRVLVKPR